MKLGISIAVFFGITIVHFILFYLITKYFQYRMNKKAEKQGEEISQVDDMIQSSDYNVEEGQYEEFLQKKKTIEHPKLISKRIREHVQLDRIKSVEESMNASKVQFYGTSMLLQQPTDKAFQSSNNFSMSLIKPYRPNRLQKSLTNLTQGKSSSRSLKSVIPFLPLIKHSYISRLVCYNQQGIHITNCVVTSLTRELDCVKQNKSVSRKLINPRDVGFSDQLQFLGFNPEIYSCMKYSVQVEIEHMIQNQEYRLKPWETYELKEEIDFSEYHFLKEKIERDLKKKASKTSILQIIGTENQLFSQN